MYKKITAKDYSIKNTFQNEKFSCTNLQHIAIDKEMWDIVGSECMEGHTNIVYFTCNSPNPLVINKGFRKKINSTVFKDNQPNHMMSSELREIKTMNIDKVDHSRLILENSVSDLSSLCKHDSSDTLNAAFLNNVHQAIVKKNDQIASNKSTE